MTLSSHSSSPGVSRDITQPDRREDRRALVNVVIPWRLVPLVLLLTAVSVLPAILSSPTTQSLADRLTPPFGFGGTGLGTDGLGRDLLARIITGTRNSLAISIVAATGASLLGITAGVLAGMLGGWADRIVELLVESVLAIPFITVGLMVTATIGQSTTSMLLLLIGTGWITHAQILRAQARMVSQAEYVIAASAMGASKAHIARRHLVPNLLPISIVVYFQQIGSMLLWSASLTWLGIGAPIEQISLGGIVRDGQDLLYNGWWVSLFAGLAIIYVVTSLNLAADWLRIVIDPVQKGHRPL
ncbi:MAG: ABC transporter permease [Thermomicrobiales bacterium]|nr:ABC transporter permease [Thermomicrobiales bacterium]